MSQGEKKRKGMLRISSNHRNNSTRLGIKESYDTQLNNNSIWASRPCSHKSSREVSLSTAFSGLSLHSKTQFTPMIDLEPPSTPSQLPKRIHKVAVPTEIPSPSKSPRRAPVNKPFLTRDSNTRAASASWGQPEDRLLGIEEAADKFKKGLEEINVERTGFKEALDIYKARGGIMTSTHSEALLMLQ